jgi:Activator of Hsp90 ATPase homolog 1-like protein
MKTTDFTTTIMVDQTPKQVFDAISNPRRWWSEEIEGSTDKLNDVFDYHFRDIHISKMKLVEVVPEKKVVWLVLGNYFNFIKDQSEWKGTKIIFEISGQDNKTKLQFTHQGLVPDYECFDICKNAWTEYIRESLYNLITTGKGKPNNRETPRTEDEKKLAAAGK